MSPLFIAVSVALVAFDFQNLLAWWHGKLLSPGEERSTDFTIIVPLFGDPKYFAGRDAIVRYRDNLLVALEASSRKMQAFASELEAEGWRVLRITMANPNPAVLMQRALPHVKTTYALRLDADTSVPAGLEHVVAAAAESDADLCSVKVEAENETTTAAKLQALEYRIAMLSRHYRPWLTSGACFIGKTASLRAIFDRHSLWTPGEDIETGRAAHALRLKIRHADFVVRTEVPETWRALFRQRRLWWAGSFRHTFVNADRNALQLPVWTAYLVLVVFASVAFKWWSLIDWRALPFDIPLVLAVYAFVTFVSNLQVRSRWMLVFPLYAMFQSFVLPPIGAVTYFLLARRRKHLGRYRFGYLRRLPAT